MESNEEGKNRDALGDRNYLRDQIGKGSICLLGAEAPRVVPLIRPMPNFQPMHT